MRGLAVPSALLFGLIAALSGCTDGDECDAASWINNPPEAMTLAAAQLPENRYRLLAGSAKEMAVERLREQPFYELSPQDANAMAGGNVSGRPFILRAASYNGHTQVMIASDAVHVVSGSLGQADRPLQCEAVLAFLDTEPSKLYVTATIAE
jgi:hypothetical protein